MTNITIGLGAVSVCCLAAGVTIKARSRRNLKQEEPTTILARTDKPTLVHPDATASESPPKVVEAPPDAARKPDPHGASATRGHAVEGSDHDGMSGPVSAILLGTGVATSALLLMLVGPTKLATAGTGRPLKDLGGAALKSALQAFWGGGPLSKGGMGIKGGRIVLTVVPITFGVSTSAVLLLSDHHRATYFAI